MELWFDDGALRARSDEPIDVKVVLPRSTSADLVVRANDRADIEVDGDPAASLVTVTVLTDPGTFRVQAHAPANAKLAGVRVCGDDVGIVSCAVDTPFRPRMATGLLRILAIKLPTNGTDLTHEVSLVAMAPVLSLLGWTIRWVDPLAGGDPQLYAAATVDLPLTEAQQVRFVPSVASAPAIGNELVLAGGAGTAPPSTGAIFQLFDPTGRCVHECGAMAASGAARALTIIPDADGSRAFLIPPPSVAALAPGFWQLKLSFAGDVNAPDLERWTVGGVAVTETAQLPLLIEEEVT